MQKFANPDMAELAHQLTLSPRRHRVSQVRGVDGLLGLVEEGKSYPYDMICYHITGYRKRMKESDKGPISGEKLVRDLIAMAEHLTRKSAVPVADLEGNYKTHEELAEDLGVSTKTVRRWRTRGLMGFRAVFEDGVSRLVYLVETISRFKKKHGDLIARGAAFKQLTPEEKSAIVDMAAELLSKRRMKLHVVAKKIAKKTGRAVETIRYTLRRYDQANPEKALFSGQGIPMVSELHRKVWESFENGESIGSIAETLGLSVERAEAVLREMQVRKLKADPVEYVHSELFDAPNADEIILDCPVPAADPNAKRSRVPKDLPAYLRSLYETPLLTADQEVDAFRRYNYLKYKASRMIAALDPLKVTSSQLGAVAEINARQEEVKKRIVQANLRLVVSIAKRHVGWCDDFFEVVSDGNMSLMRAVEKFDYSRGFKFSTYASWAIMKNFARTVPESRYHLNRYVTGQEELLDGAADYREPLEPKLDEQGLVAALKDSMRELTDRERDIVTSHFGLFGSGQSSTLEQLGNQYGVTKERVRQIERKAIKKMKAVLSPSLVDMLPE